MLRFLVIMCGLALTAGASAQDNLRLAPYHGYTGEKFDTTKASYDYLVDSSLSKDDPAGHKYRTVQAAYAAAPAGTEARPTVIGIKPDVYLLPGGDTQESMNITKSWITLEGLTDDRRKVVLADNRGNKEGASNNGYILMVNATGFSMVNLTLVNYCNLDYEYPGDPSKNLKKRSDVITQAVALQADGDKHVYSHVAFLGRLDTLFIRTTRSYFTHVYVEGTDDFIGGGTVGVWEDSEVYFPTGNGVMSSSGIAFINTRFRAERGVQFYKGFHNPVALIRCIMPANTEKTRVAWMVWKAPARQNEFSVTYKTVDETGKPAVLYDSIVGPHTFLLSRELTETEAKAFNPWNMLRAAPNGTVDDWDPAGARAKYESNGSDVFRMTMIQGSDTARGDRGAMAGSQARGTAPSATSGPFMNTEGSGNTSVRTGAAGATLSVSALPQRAAGGTITWSTDSKLVLLSSTTGKSIVVKGNNTGDRAEYATVKAVAADGFYVVSHVKVEPAYVDPPAFASAPKLSVVADGTVSVAYTLNLNGRDDQSLITWYQCDDAACAARREVAVSRNDVPLRRYTLTVGDAGKYIEAAVEPKMNISEPGPAVTAITAKPVTAAEVTEKIVSPEFRNFVEAENTAYSNGMWTVLGKWTVSTGENLVHGYGLRVSSQGAALLYQNDAKTDAMQISVVLTPEKTQGQGFGIGGVPDDSAGERNQKADIYIKYDPRTKNGYSLRFWRTIQSAEKCMFQLYQVVDGVGHPISNEQQLTGVFKPNATITLAYSNGMLTAKGTNTTDAATLSLSTKVTPNTFGGAGVKWTGSVPFGNSVVVSQFKITY